MGVPTHISSSGAAGTSITQTGNWPTTQDGDIMIVSLALTNSTSPAATPPAGWTTISDVTNNTGASATNIRMITTYKRCGASETAPTWSSITGYRFFCNTQLRGCIASGTPYDLQTTGNVASATTSFSAATGNTSMSDCLMVYHIATDLGSSSAQFSSEANSSLSSVTEQYDTTVSGGSGCNRTVVTGGLATAGGSGTLTATMTNSCYVWSAIALLSTTSVSAENGGFLFFYP